MKKETICWPVAISLAENKILRLFIKVIIYGKKKIVFLDRSGKIYEIVDERNSLLSSAISKRGYILLSKEVSNESFFKYGDLGGGIEKLENLIKKIKIVNKYD